MFVKDIMRKAVCVEPDVTLAVAARQLKELNIGCMPVCSGKQVLGMLTDRDIAMRAVADGRSAETMTVREAMSVGALCCFETDTAQAAGTLMKSAHVRRLVVLDHRRHIAGIVSITDLGGCASQRRPFEIVFFKEILDHMGTVHRSELMRATLARTAETEAISDAIRQFEQTRHIGDWRLLADGYSVNAIPSDSST
jgi:CBS domain-containing protein